MKNFRTYDLAVAFYHSASALCLPRYLQDQLARASSSIVLNLAEGRGKRTRTDQLRFFQIALGSARECEAIFDLCPGKISPGLAEQLNHLCASTYLLIKRAV